MSLTPEHRPRFPTRFSRAIGIKMQRDRRHDDRRTSDRRSRMVDRIWLLLVTLLWVWSITTLQNQQDQQNKDRVEGTRQRCELVRLNVQTLQLSILSNRNSSGQALRKRLVKPYTDNLRACERTLGSLDPEALKDFLAEGR